MQPLKAEENVTEILSSSDESECESLPGSPVVLVEPVETSVPEEKLEEVVDKEFDLVVTFCKKPDVLPHARYDCAAHPFTRTECETCSPVEKNDDICDHCYCYICDKLASECENWTVPSICHCNAHNKSKFWKNRREVFMAGILGIFNLHLTDIDADLWRGGDLLKKFIQELSVEYNNYLLGEVPPTQHECSCLPKLPPGQCNICGSRSTEVVYKYSGVFTLVTKFLNQAEKENPKATAVMFLGAAKEIALHKDPALNWQNFGYSSSLMVSVTCLLQRITTGLQRMLVLCNFPKTLHEKFIGFFRSIPLPCHCFVFSNSLNIVPWDNVLLTAVLRGRTASGRRRTRGRRPSLWEWIAVVEARVERLVENKKYKEIVHYLRAVKCNDIKGLRRLQDKIPFYLCKSGNFLDASHSLLVPVNNLTCCIACRLTASEYEAYLKMFRTGSVPDGDDVLHPGLWVVAGQPLREGALIKQALRMLHSSVSLYRNPKCWSTLIMILGSNKFLGKSGHLYPAPLREPSLDYQEEVLSASFNILEELKNNHHAAFRAYIFSPEFYQETSLIVAVQAIQQMVFCDLPYLTSFLEIVLAFGRNFWALKLLLNQLSHEETVLNGTVDLILRDLHGQKTTMLKLWQNLGPLYVGEFLCLFLTCRNPKMQSIALLSLNIITENLDMCPWAKHLCSFFQNTGLKDLPLDATGHLEVVKFMSLFDI
ncbi:uncharacterized protein [Melopsittacus undulatus]|uniref:uncharacterized protein n=1 Tax=Melopsittacus undulatus TaxID=13146 RepID=UPI00146DFA2C|nr:uncharacterized protein LOC115945836 [Melopsittacus undulatus]